MNPNEKPRPRGKGLAARNNPLGQEVPSSQVGPEGKESVLKHDQSAELVEEVRERAHEIEGEGTQDKPPSKDYDPKGPVRQPGKVARQKDPDTQSRQK